MTCYHDAIVYRAGRLLLSAGVIIQSCFATIANESGPAVSDSERASDTDPKIVASHVLGYMTPRWLTSGNNHSSAASAKETDLVWILQTADMIGEKDLLAKVAHQVRANWPDSNGSTGVIPDQSVSPLLGCTLLELHRQTREQDYLKAGRFLADREWGEDAPVKGRWETPAEIEQVHLSVKLAVQASLETGTNAYLNHAADSMLAFCDQRQRPNGLFYVTPAASVFWARANGSIAVGLSQLIAALPERDARRESLLKSYRALMSGVLACQGSNGLWKVVLDEPEAYDESSGTALLTAALAYGVKRGWLTEEAYDTALRKGWSALTETDDPHIPQPIGKTGKVYYSCITPKDTTDRSYYVNLPAQRGGRQGQTAALVCCIALLE